MAEEKCKMCLCVVLNLLEHLALAFHGSIINYLLCIKENIWTYLTIHEEQDKLIWTLAINIDATVHKEENSFQLRSNPDLQGCRKTLTLHGKKLLHTLCRTFKISDSFVQRKASQEKKNSRKEIKETMGKATNIANRVSIPSILLVYIWKDSVLC